MQKGDLNKFYVAPRKEKAVSMRTEMDQNKYWMYFVRRGIEWLKKEKGYRNIDQICASALALRDNLGYTAPSPSFIIKTMRGDANNLVSELSVMNFFNLMGVDCIQIGSEAMKDYMEDALLKYRLVINSYVPTRPVDPHNKLWIRQMGSTPFSKRGVLKWGYYSSPFRSVKPQR